MTPPAPKHPTLFSIVYTWIGERSFFHWPSIVTEIVSGLLLAFALAVVVLILHGWIMLAILATVASIFYELRLDPNGWDVTDVVEREIGIVLGVIIVHLVLRL